MYLMYVDESGDPGPIGGSRFYVMCGVIVDEGQWRPVTDAFNRLLEDKLYPDRARSRSARYPLLHWPHPLGVDVKGHKIRHGKGEFVRLAEASRLELESQLLGLAGDFGLAVMAVALDKPAIRASKWPRRPLEVHAFARLARRFALYLEGRGERGLTIMDARQARQDLEVRLFHEGLRQDLGDAALDYPLQHGYGQVIGTLYTVPSHFERLLQLADVCAYALADHLLTGNEEFVSLLGGSALGPIAPITDVRGFFVDE